MTRRSVRLCKRSENGVQNRKMAKQSNGMKAQPVSKRQNEKTRQVLGGASGPVKALCVASKPGYVTHTSRDVSMRTCPLLSSWGPLEHVMRKMEGKERKYKHSKDALQLHPRMEAGMRSTLLDWLLEVSEYFSLHRQTFYLAQDYLDRFLLTQLDINKGILQLIGITCLFIAAKVEEVNPPKVGDLAFMTDEAFLDFQILDMELIVLKALKWNLCPETAMSWLNFYIQAASLSGRSDVLKPHFSEDVYIQVTRLLDLCILSINSLDFQYRVLAASALCHFMEYETVSKVSGLSREDIEACAVWMAPFVTTVVLCDRAEPKDFRNVPSADRHNIQTYTNYMTMLEASHQREVADKFLTPPNSTEKVSAH